jgi:hypothetical protein
MRPACDLGSPRKMNHHGSIDRFRRPGFDGSCSCDLVHRPAWIKTGRYGGSTIETIPLMKIGAGAATRINLRFQDGYIQSGFCQYRRSCQSPHPGANDNYSIHSNIRLVFQARKANSSGSPRRMDNPTNHQKGCRRKSNSTSSTTSVVFSSNATKL